MVCVYSSQSNCPRGFEATVLVDFLDRLPWERTGAPETQGRFTILFCVLKYIKLSS